MLDFFCSERISGIGAEALHPSVRYTVKEDNERFDELSGTRIADRRFIPRPSKFGKGAKEASKGQKSVAPENAALWM